MNLKSPKSGPDKSPGVNRCSTVDIKPGNKHGGAAPRPGDFSFGDDCQALFLLVLCNIPQRLFKDRGYIGIMMSTCFLVTLKHQKTNTV